MKKLLNRMEIINEKPILPDETIAKKRVKLIRIYFILFISTVITVNLILVTLYMLSKYDIFIANSYRYNLIEISSEDNNWHQTNNINIFKKTNKKGEKILFPGQSGNYNFIISNEGNNTIYYRINLEEKNVENINIKYRLKHDNVYISGNENTWLKADEIYLKDILILSNNKTHYTLEWKYFNSENDEQLLREGLAQYNIYLNIYSSIY